MFEYLFKKVYGIISKPVPITWYLLHSLTAYFGWKQSKDVVISPFFKNESYKMTRASRTVQNLQCKIARRICAWTGSQKDWATQSVVFAICHYFNSRREMKLHRGRRWHVRKARIAFPAEMTVWGVPLETFGATLLVTQLSEVYTNTALVSQELQETNCTRGWTLQVELA